MLATLRPADRAEELYTIPELRSILVRHAYLGVRVQFLIRSTLLIFMTATVAFVPPAHDRDTCYLVVACYAVWISGLAVWTHRGGDSPVRWMWIALIVDAIALGSLTLVAGTSADQSWTADILVNGLFLIPVLAAAQLRPSVCTAIVIPTVLVYLLSSLATQSANTEPNSSVFLRTFVLTALSAASVALSYVQRSRVLMIAGLAKDRAGLLADLLTVEARERTQLSEQLHDGALQYVLAARQDLEDARDGTNPQAFERVQYALSQSSGMLRATVSELHPAVLREAGLHRALQDLVSRESKRLQLTIDLEASGWTESRSALDDLLFAASRELLTNIGKHANASVVRIELTQRNGAVRLVMADDGCGFSDGALNDRLAQGHIGLASLRTRIVSAGGTLTLTANRPSGTIAMITLPR